MAALLPLPAVPCDACDKQAGRVSSLPVVRRRTSGHSVPVVYGHREVLVRGYVTQVVNSCGAEVIARHRRTCERDGFVFDPIRYLPFLERKTAVPGRDETLAGWELPREFGALRPLPAARPGQPGRAGWRKFVQVPGLPGHHLESTATKPGGKNARLPEFGSGKHIPALAGLVQSIPGIATTVLQRRL